MYRFIIIKKRVALLCALLLALTLAGGICFAAAGVVTTQEELPPQEGVRLPVLMYHSVLKNTSSAGKYVISPDTFESDLKYLKEHGYTSVLSGEVIDYVKNGGTLPEKSVMLTLDDGYLNNLTYVVPLLEQYDMKAVISVVGSYAERFSADHNPNYSYFSFDDITECINSGRIEIGNHTYDMHKQGERRGSMKKRGESDAAYEKALSEDLQKTQDLLMEHCKIKPRVFAYPFGAVSNASEDIVKKLGFEMSLGCGENVNLITPGDESKLYQMCRFNRASGISTEKFMERIER